MRDNLRELLRRIASRFTSSSDVNVRQSSFVDLAPTDKADEAGVYSDALMYATNNPRVSNIALTGPYGSGKSSIISSFLKRYPRPVLQISLAAFLPDVADGGDHVSKQEIERSILQQMLYGADANRLPLSRFKRIQTPRKIAPIISLYIALGFIACWHLITHAEDLVSGEYFHPFGLGNWFNILAFLIGGTFLWQVAHHLYIASFGVSLKSISLKDIEITPIAATQESILNRHLDEIIYFFQSTKYDLVVIEDLDRFNNSDIFVTLREINSLVNANASVTRTIRFLYALRDDMFQNTDRTKFFEFIIPVIPIINSSNSIDKVIEQGKRLSLDDRLDPQFLREVSRYLNDLRLIQNIFNEYAIYVANLETGDEKVLDPNKLLAILIYKNVFPRDFEDLHRDKGNLASILSSRDEIIASAEREYKREITELEGQIEDAKKQVPSDLNELRSIYAAAIIAKLPAGTWQVSIDGPTAVALPALAKSEVFDQFVEATRVLAHSVHGNQRVDMSGVQSSVSSEKTYQQRKTEIERKSADFTQSVSKKVRELRARLADLRIAKFHEVLRISALDFEQRLGAFGENAELARFLVLEGYLDDTYYQYTSLFHTGRLSVNDNKFLIQIRSFITPDPELQIDNPKEVIEAMRDDDFRQAYALNVKIVNCLLRESDAYARQTSSLIVYLSSHFMQCEKFLLTYYAAGTEVPALVDTLFKEWNEFLPTAVASSHSLTHIAQVLAHMPSQTLRALPTKYPPIAEFVSANLAAILGSGVDVETARLKLVRVKSNDLAAVGGFPGVARFLFEEGLYSLTTRNLEFIFRAFLGLEDLAVLQTRNYSTVLEAANQALITKIEIDFEEYFENVLGKLENNSEEDLSAILAVIGHDDIDIGDISVFLEKQSTLIPSLQQVPTRLHALVFQLGKIEGSWENCIAFMASDNFDADSLTAYLNTELALGALSAQDVPDGDSAHPLRRFIVDNDALQNDLYRTYVRRLPKQFKGFPDGLGPEKLRVLIEERKIVFSAENLSALDEGGELQVLFVAHNIQRFLSEEQGFVVDDDFREALLSADIQDEYKLAIIQSMDLGLLPDLPSRARIIGSILNRTGADVVQLDAQSARAIILNAAPTDVQICLLNRYNQLLAVDEIREILLSLPAPYSEITTGFRIPRVKNTPHNRELVRWLDSRDIISSWRDSLYSDDIQIYLFRR